MWEPERESQNVEDRRAEGPPWWYTLGLPESPQDALTRMVEDLKDPFSPRIQKHEEVLAHYEYNPLAEALGMNYIPYLNPDFSAGNPDPTIRRPDPPLGRRRR